VSSHYFQRKSGSSITVVLLFCAGVPTVTLKTTFSMVITEYLTFTNAFMYPIYYLHCIVTLRPTTVSIITSAGKHERNHMLNIGVQPAVSTRVILLATIIMWIWFMYFTVLQSLYLETNHLGHQGLQSLSTGFCPSKPQRISLSINI
jgi:hypothetical protein